MNIEKCFRLLDLIIPEDAKDRFVTEELEDLIINEPLAAFHAYINVIEKLSIKATPDFAKGIMFGLILASVSNDGLYIESIIQRLKGNEEK